MGDGYLSVLVLIGGSEIPKQHFVLSVEVVQELNKIPYADIIIHDGDVRTQTYPLSEESLYEPGAEVEIKTGYGPGNEETIFKGIIVEHGIRHSTYSGSSLVLKCKDKAAKMAVGRKNKIFHDQTDADIISAVVGEAGLSASTDSTSGSHEKLIQYHCSDWDFVLSRADANGLVTIVDDGKLDVKKPVFDDCGVVLSFGKDIIELNLKLNSSHQYSEVQANFWDPATQSIDNSTSAKPSANAQGNIKSDDLTKVTEPEDLVQTPALVTQDVLKALASAVHQRGHLSRVQGTARFNGTAKPKIGKTIEFFGTGERFNGAGYVSKVRHIIERGTWLSEVGLGLPTKMYLDEHRDATTLPAGGLLPSVHGLHIGVVKQIHDDPEGEFRVLINIPVIDKAEGEGIWARMAHYYATKTAGFVWYPEVADEVVVGFLDNDPAYPIILGSLYSSSIPLQGEHEPDAENTYKAFSTSKGKMKIEFEDVKKIITVITPNKHTIVISDDEDSITIEDPVNKNKMVMDSSGILLEADKDITLKSKANIIMEALSDIKMKATANIKAEATANYEMKATAQMKAEGTAGIELKSAAMAKLEGAAMTEIKGGLVKIN